MIYCGVKLNQASCHIVLLTEAFAKIDHCYFSEDEQDQLPIWISLAKNSPDEQIQWFFDEHELKEHKYKQTIYMLLDSINEDEDATFVINHRKLANMMQFLYEWMVQESMFMPTPEKAWLLASAVRLFDDNERSEFVIDEFAF